MTDPRSCSKCGGAMTKGTTTIPPGFDRIQIEQGPTPLTFSINKKGFTILRWECTDCGWTTPA